MAYDGWLVGHARWFRSAAGRKLLDALRRRAWAAGCATASAERSHAMIWAAIANYIASHAVELAGP